MNHRHVTSPFHVFASIFFQRSWHMVSDIIWPSNLTLSWVCTEAVSLPSPAWDAVMCLQDAVDEDSHDGSTDQTGYGYRHEPRHEDISEQTPVHRLPRTKPPNCDHGANL